MSQVPTIPRLYRTEIEVAANTVIAMNKAGLVKRGVTVGQMADAVGVTKEELRLASVRLERMPARRFGPTGEPTRAAPPTAMPLIGTKGRDPEASVTNGLRAVPTAQREPQYVPPVRYTEAGRKRVAERIFAEWRVRGDLDCSRCGKPIYSGSDAVIESAHHAGRCP